MCALVVPLCRRKREAREVHERSEYAQKTKGLKYATAFCSLPGTLPVHCSYCLCCPALWHSCTLSRAALLDCYWRARDAFCVYLVWRIMLNGSMRRAYRTSSVDRIFTLCPPIYLPLFFWGGGGGFLLSTRTTRAKLFNKQRRNEKIQMKKTLVPHMYIQMVFCCTVSLHDVRVSCTT